MSKNYTDSHVIIRGSRWPPIGNLPVRLELRDWDGDAVNWADVYPHADEWEWWLEISRHLANEAADLRLEAVNATIDGQYLTLEFRASHIQTAALPGSGRKDFLVDLMSIHARTNTTTTAGPGGMLEARYWSTAHGTAEVRDAVGEG